MISDHTTLLPHVQKPKIVFLPLLASERFLSCNVVSGRPSQLRTKDDEVPRNCRDGLLVTTVASPEVVFDELPKLPSVGIEKELVSGFRLSCGLNGPFAFVAVDVEPPNLPFAPIMGDSGPFSVEGEGNAPEMRTGLDGPSALGPADILVPPCPAELLPLPSPPIDMFKPRPPPPPCGSLTGSRTEINAMRELNAGGGITGESFPPFS